MTGRHLTAHAGVMTLTDYILDIFLISLVIWQVRGRRLSLYSLLLPVATISFAVITFLHTIPTAGNDLYLVAATAAAGLTCGALCGALTHIRPGPGGVPYARAGVAAAGLWVLGTGTRLAFQLYATHGGGPAIVGFSARHDITSTAAWTAALILMAAGEVAARTLVLAWRGYGPTARRRVSPPRHDRPLAADPASPDLVTSGDHAH
jgi:hypothetical protein